MTETRKAVVLLNGGLDSTTVLAIARNKGYEPYALSFRYGQRHTEELEAAKKIAVALGTAEHVIADIDFSVFGGSALTEGSLPVPHHESAEDIDTGIPITYVPAACPLDALLTRQQLRTLGQAISL